MRWEASGSPCLDGDWDIWVGENDASPEQVKSSANA